MPLNKSFDQIPQELIPQIRLSNGHSMPAIGLGTFGSDHADADLVASVVREALMMGYRYIDCASVYGNEKQIGLILREAMDNGLKREDLFIVGKLWNDKHSPSKAREACLRSIDDLNVGYLDAYLVHWPFPNYHAPGCDGDSRDPNSKPYIHEEFMDTWRVLEQLTDEGFIKAPGTSNVTIPKLKLILRDARIKPVVSEMEMHPCFRQDALFTFCLDHGIQPIAYSPLGSPARPERDKTPDDLADMQEPVVVEIARRHNVHPAAVCLKWAVQNGQVPIPFTTKPSNALSNLRAVTEDPLTAEEMELMRSAEHNCRLIKGQVFLWPGADSWLDLWDVDGTIPGFDGYVNK